ncbi:MAG: ATP-binding cassette domain-containing protein, partial [Pseudomonadota bacterium]
MLRVDALTLHYGQSQILNGIDLTAQPGAVTAVMGTNGVGKTSLLKAIAGRHPYSGGSISLDDAPLTHLSAFQAARAGIAYVPQGREVFPLMSVTENLEAGFACLPKS